MPGWEGWSAFYSRLLRCRLLWKSLGLNSREDEGGWDGRDWRGSLLPRALPHSSTLASAMGRRHLPWLLALPSGSAAMSLPLPNPALSQTLCVTLENLSLPSVPQFSMQRDRLSGCPGERDGVVMEREDGVWSWGGFCFRAAKIPISVGNAQEYRVCARRLPRDPCGTEYD